MGAVLAISLLLPALGSAAEPEPKKLSPPSTFELARGRDHLGLRGAISESPSELRFWPCPERGPCPEVEPTVRVPLPAEVVHAAFERTVPTIDGVPLLHLKAEGSAGPFHVLVAPPERKADRSGLSILLGGELRAGESLNFLSDQQLIIQRKVHACDDPNARELSVNVRRLDMKRREFVRARNSLLDDAEVAKAELGELKELPPTLPAAVLPLVGSTSEAPLWVIGEGRGESPWATLAFRGDGQKSVRVELKAGPEAELFLVRPDKIVRFSVPTSETQRDWVLSLPSDPDSNLSKGCLLLATGKNGAPVRAVSLQRENQPFGSPESWVRELSGADAALYQSALRTEAAAAARAIEKEWPNLDAIGRARALEILGDTPDEFALDPFITAAGLGSEVERERAMKELSYYEPAVVFAHAEERFAKTRGPRAPGFAYVMARVQPEAALPKIAARLGEPRRRSKNQKQRDEELSIRKELRAVLGVAVRGATEFKDLERLLGTKELGRSARLELLRAYGPRRRSLGFSLVPFVVELGGDFTSDYVLLELGLELFAELPAEAKSRITTRLAARTDPKYQPIELLAYQARLLELLSERDLPKETLSSFRRGALACLSASSRVVREAALIFLRESEFRATGAESERLLGLIDEDEWPEVRAEAAITYGTLATLLAEAERDLAESELEKRLKRNRDDPVVLRALVRALAKSGGARARSALQSVLERKGLAEARGDAADALGRLCEKSAVAPLTEHALRLQSPASESDVTIGLASVRALARLRPADLDRRLAPLMQEKVPGPIRGQVTMILESTPASCGVKK